MRHVSTNRLGAAALLCAMGSVVGISATSAQAELVYGTNISGLLSSWDSATPGVIIEAHAVQGLQANEVVLGLDFNPINGQLYAIGSFSHLYTINPATGVASVVAAGPSFNPAMNGSAFGFDINPFTQQANLVSNSNQFLRLSTTTGQVVTSSPMAYAFGDGSFGIDPNIVHIAFSNNLPNAPTPQLFAIDTGRDLLLTATDAGTLTTVGSLGRNVNELGGFDISGSGIAYATLMSVGETRSTFVRINLANGTLTDVGEVGGGNLITAMTVVPVPTPGSLALCGAALLTIARRRSR